MQKYSYIPEINNLKYKKTNTFGSYDPIIYLKRWLKYILANENPNEVQDREIELIKSKITISLQLITVPIFRKILKKLKLNHLCKNTSLILKKITGIGPPNLQEIHKSQLINLFIRINQTIKFEIERQYNIYYPYIIYKILDLIISINDPSRRILFYINVQTCTLKTNELNWEIICKKLKLEFREVDLS